MKLLVNFTNLRPVCGGARTCNDGSSLNGLKVEFSSSRQDKTRLTAAARDLKHAAAATKKSKKKVAHLRSERTVNGPTSSKRLLAVARGLFARSQLSV